MKQSKFLIALVTLLTFFTCTFAQTVAETFRVHNTIVKSITDQTSITSADLGINDALVLTIAEKTPFLQAIDLQIKIPAPVAEYRNSVAYSLYADVSPAPQQGIIDYSGKRANINTFPDRISCNIRIPLVKNHTMQQSPYTTILPAVFAVPNKTIFFRMQLVMKGVPQELLDSVFHMDIKPVLTNQGLLDLKIVYPDGKKPEQNNRNFSVFIDEQSIPFTGSPMLLEAGAHRLNIQAEQYRSEVRSFAVEQAKTLLLEVKLKDITPMLSLSLPLNTRFFMDGTEVKDYSRPFAVKPGTHQMRFSFGDYELVRTLKVVNGKSYNVSASFDLNVTEE